MKYVASLQYDINIQMDRIVEFTRAFDDDTVETLLRLFYTIHKWKCEVKQNILSADTNLMNRFTMQTELEFNFQNLNIGRMAPEQLKLYQRYFKEY